MHTLLNLLETIKKPIRFTLNALLKYCVPKLFVRLLLQQYANDEHLQDCIRDLLNNEEIREHFWKNQFRKKERGLPNFLPSEPSPCFWWIGKNVDEEGNRPFFDDLSPYQKKLESGLDELSLAVVRRLIRIQIEAMRPIDGWLCFSKKAAFEADQCLTQTIDRTEQQRIRNLAATYKCPYRLPESEMLLEHFALGYGVSMFRPEQIKRLLNADIIDGGGYLGDSAMAFSEFGPKRIFVFEPNPAAFSEMQNVLDDNKSVLGKSLHTILPTPFALGEKMSKQTFFSTGKMDVGANLLSPLGRKQAFDVDVVSIDEFVNKQELNIGLIKLDIEGAEYSAILGAKNTIQTQKPLLIISIYHTAKDFFEIKPLIESWDVGYRFFVRHLIASNSPWDFCLFAFPE